MLLRSLVPWCHLRLGLPLHVPHVLLHILSCRFLRVHLDILLRLAVRFALQLASHYQWFPRIDPFYIPCIRFAVHNNWWCSKLHLQSPVSFSLLCHLVAPLPELYILIIRIAQFPLHSSCHPPRGSTACTHHQSLSPYSLSIWYLGTHSTCRFFLAMRWTTSPLLPVMLPTLSVASVVCLVWTNFFSRLRPPGGSPCPFVAELRRRLQGTP